jgi:hypothetical protein
LQQYHGGLFMLRSFFAPLTEETDIKYAPYQVEDIPGFPAKEYKSRVSLYREWEGWYTGAKLEETVTDQGEEIELYPARINPLPGSALKHAHTLFGETIDDGAPLVSPKFVKHGTITDDQVTNAEEVLRAIWADSAARTLQYTNGLISQIYGGAIFKADYLPQDKSRAYPIKISKIHPLNFMGILMPDEEFRLSEAWYIKNVSSETAKKYGVIVPEEEIGLWVEYWNPEEHSIKINGDPIRRSYNGVIKSFDGRNVFGEVPVVYLPHERTLGLWGTSMIHPLIGLVRELNARAADYGDAVSDDSHETYALRNSSNPKVITLGGKRVLDLGSNNSAVGMNSGDPDLFAFSDAKASAPMSQIVDDLYKHYRRAAYIPAVADGEDEGSQRSGMTLAFRMWPMTSHVSTERIFWTSGLDHFTKILVRFCASKGIVEISENITKASVRQEWLPMLPRDREAMVNEAVLRITNGLGSPQAMLRLLGDTENIEDEMKLIEKWKRFLAEVESTMNQFGNEQNGNVGSAPKNQSQQAKNRKAEQTRSKTES